MLLPAYSILLACLTPLHFSFTSLARLHSTASPPSPATETVSTKATNHECTFCSEQFTSRNGLFRHIRSQHDTNGILPTKQSIVFHFGYIGIHHEQAGKLLLQAFVNATLDVNHVVLGTTQTSSAKARSLALSQEANCPAALDMLVVNFIGPLLVWNDETNATDASNSTAAASIMNALMKNLDGTNVTLHGLRPLQAGDRSIHAEQSCSQHVYHFLLPLSWLPDGAAIAQTLHNSKSSTLPILHRLKRILRSVESRRLIQQANDAPKDDTAGEHTTSFDSNNNMASSRFGLLKHRAKRPWHNFADPALRGAASPNNQVVWRVIDRARIIGWRNATNDKDAETIDVSQVYLIIEFRGDQFLQQQVRRIMGATVAMLHEWLPDNFLEQATDRRVSVETPLAPAGYLYRAGSRHHAIEMYRKGRQLFDWHDVYKADAGLDPILLMQQQLMSTARMAESEAWLVELRDQVAPRVRAQLQAMQSQPIAPFAITNLAPAPMIYQPVLHLLQGLVDRNEWPATSSARASVIMGDIVKGAGSFTVVSKHYQVGASNMSYSLPLGNTLFPELATAVYDLERSLSAGTNRQASSHCAINCNAQFTPHVDSGRGSGQSLSMIVALGDFVGGEIMVEGEPHDIRYKALEFDGWKLRHWTRAFTGQRFSLVWFTPEDANERNDKIPVSLL
ncbi:hypothetical protein MPSEU_000193600 [Mayamaea pseudoterrestris]|nr:hypothetical protein MPSEU_000193600 [Mayamaea pseudoterrestris]